MHLTRRALLEIGGLGLLGSQLAPFADAQPTPQGRRRARAKSVIFLHQYGGPGHLDTFDMKPGTPPEFRGIYRPIQTSAPGIQICEKLPRMAPYSAPVISLAFSAEGGILATGSNDQTMRLWDVTRFMRPGL